jgi:transposase
MNRTTYGLDIAKNVMQLRWVDGETGEIGRKKLVRAKLGEYFAQLQPVRIVMEACGSAHHWARVLVGLGHQVKLLPARQVRPFVRSNRDDAADARAIWLAAQQSDIRPVPQKTVDQQAVMALHRSRQHRVPPRTGNPSHKLSAASVGPRHRSSQRFARPSHQGGEVSAPHPSMIGITCQFVDRPRCS